MVSSKKDDKNANANTSEDEKMQVLGVIAANTMCLRQAVGVAAKIGKAWIISSAIIAIAIVILINNPVTNPKDLQAVHYICYGVMVIFGLFMVIYPVGLLAELDQMTEMVAENEKEMLEEEQ